MSVSIDYSQLLADGEHLTKRETMAILASALLKGTLLGKITKGAVTSAAHGEGTDGANTGDGTCVPDATAPLQAHVQVGEYLVIFTAATKAAVYDPAGAYLGEMTVGTAWTKQIKFLITAGDTAFVAGDGFAITVAEGSGYVKQWSPSAVDGSEIPYAILMDDVAANVATQIVPVYISGRFVAQQIVLPSGSEAADVQDALRNVGIYLVDQIDTNRHAQA